MMRTFLAAAAVLPLAVLYGLQHFSATAQRSRAVPRTAWSARGLAGLASSCLPTVLQRSDKLPSTQWRALTRWHSEQYLSETFAPLHSVWERQISRSDSDHADDRTFVYFAENGERGGASYGMRAPPHAPAETASVIEHTKMPMKMFMARAHRGALLYCSHDLAALGEAAKADAWPLWPFDLRVPEDGNYATTQGIVWLGAGRPITHAHYDTSHNVFVQLVGRKHFTLWSPESLRSSLRLFPSRHSMHRQSMLRDPVHDATSDTLEVTLEEGEALYLPPFYAHHVRALDNLSISVAIWSDSDAALRKDSLDRLPLPWEAEWSADEVLLAAVHFLRSAIASVHGGDLLASRAMLSRLLTSRYQSLHMLTEKEREGLLPPDGKAGQEDRLAVCSTRNGAVAARSTELGAHVWQGALRVADAVRDISDDVAIREVALANYIEAVSEFVVGASMTYSFLSTCVLAGVGVWGNGK